MARFSWCIINLPVHLTRRQNMQPFSTMGDPIQIRDLVQQILTLERCPSKRSRPDRVMKQSSETNSSPVPLSVTCSIFSLTTNLATYVLTSPESHIIQFQFPCTDLSRCIFHLNILKWPSWHNFHNPAARRARSKRNNWFDNSLSLAIFLVPEHCWSMYGGQIMRVELLEAAWICQRKAFQWTWLRSIAFVRETASRSWAGSFFIVVCWIQFSCDSSICVLLLTAFTISRIFVPLVQFLSIFGLDWYITIIGRPIE